MKKSIVITGAAGNLGQAVTSSLVENGYTIYATLGPNDNPSNIENDNVFAENVNLLNAEESENYIKKVSSNNIEGMVCIVGGFAMGTIYESSIETINKMIALNFATAYNVVQPLLKQQRENKNPLQLIFIGSRAALNPEEGQQEIAYSLSKSLLLKLADTINASTNETGVLASVIVPSTLDTPGTRKAMPDNNPKEFVPTQEIANTVNFILSDAGKMMREPIYKIYNKS